MAQEYSELSYLSKTPKRQIRIVFPLLKVTLSVKSEHIENGPKGYLRAIFVGDGQ